MNTSNLITFLSQSFLGKYLLVKSITDISYNGHSIFVLDNEKGRLKSEIFVEQQTVRDFIRQIANICEKQFSYQSPYLDVSFANFRINAVHQSIGRYLNEEVVTFSIRIGSTQLRISDSSDFLTPELVSLFKTLIKSKLSIAVAGLTGSGKTELQKYLISLMPEMTRTIIIDNVSELSYLQLNDSVDITSWLANEEIPLFSSKNLIKTALRNNPDWLIVAESRGEEMWDVLNSVLTGHPIITTLHSLDVDSMPTRMTRMVMMSNGSLDYQTVYDDITYHISFYIYTKRIISDSKVTRYVSNVSYFYSGKMNPIFIRDNNKLEFHKIDKTVLRKISEENMDDLFIKTFTEDYE